MDGRKDLFYSRKGIGEDIDVVYYGFFRFVFVIEFVSLFFRMFGVGGIGYMVLLCVGRIFLRVCRGFLESFFS